MGERRIPSLDGLRAISIALVMLSHLSQAKHLSFTFSAAYGRLGVNIFFVLSGYLISSILLREQERTSKISLGNFYIRRAFRIFPAAFAFLAVATVLYWRDMRWYHVAAAVFYVANMDVPRPSIFSHLWSLSIEEQFYLLWPLALQRWHRHKTAILLCTLLITPVSCAACYAFKVRGGLAASLPTSADQLAIGCLLAVFARRLPSINRYLVLAMIGAIVFIPLFNGTSAPRTLFMLFVLGPILNFSIAGLVWHVIQVPYRALNWTPVVWLGKISYSLYLWQELFCAHRGPHHAYTLVLASVLCAALSYHLVEQPLLQMREKWARKSEPEISLQLQPDSLPA